MSFKETILQETFKIFQKNGVNEVESATLLYKLDISKSTFREIAETRQELVTFCIESAILNSKAIISRSISNSNTATEGILALIQPFLADIQDTNPKFINDLQTDYPEAWNLVSEFFNDYCFKCFQELFTQGIADGEFETELNASIITGLFLAQLASVFNQPFLTETASREATMQAAVLIFLKGLSTPMGSELIGQNQKIILNDQEF